MSDSITFENTTPRFALPLLQVGQAQKEAFVNEALSRCDMMLHGTVSGERADPPGDPAAGETWLVAEGATGEWSGKQGCLAGFHGGNWLFAQPCEGLRIYDLSTRQERLFDIFWRKASLPVEPLGGMTVDVQARAAIAEVIVVLQALGIVPSA
ncbi:uncharacterized protein DUF2793 [Novosphingobium sp. PhB57]|uniref:DUF2793 domain-containing protein n=1 Tax=Novosphingobium sp. PhB57 TaxID=2485107 RepID=UPI0010435BF0|nr:DUF2793 domain-containing protein [Novosphingobium sp. PhB57]TCU59593.1 uncharacterized protein DUF2793 [Novosphingobium sp. PhB57]